MDFRVEAGDKILAGHIASAPANATYTSGDIQNQLIDIIGDQIAQRIVDRVKDAGWFTVIADEVTDVANKEQLNLVSRYVDLSTKVVREDFVVFVECAAGVTGEALAKLITDTITILGLDLGKLRGQSYDGAGNMAGARKGAAARITEKYPRALYLHCASHCLNLVVVSSLQDRLVQNIMGVVTRVAVFFDSHPKRQKALEAALNDADEEPDTSKVKDLCRTRWVQRLDALESFLALHPMLVVCFNAILDEGPQAWSRDSITDANGLLTAITNTDFIAALVIVNKCLHYVRGITSSLQAEAKDLIAAMHNVSSVTTTLAEVRRNVDNYHGEWFEVVKSVCEAVHVTPSLPRLCGRQTQRNNVQADTPVQYYRRALTVPILDHMVSEIEARFTPHHSTALQGFCAIPALLLKMSMDAAKSQVQELVKLYDDDFVSGRSMEAELHCWRVKWVKAKAEHGEASLPTSVSAALPHASQMFPNIRCLLQLLATLPVTSCSSERSFSALKLVKDRQRSVMKNSRLSGLTLLQVHHDIPVDVGAVIDEFARRHPRRMQLVNVLHSEWCSVLWYISLWHIWTVNTNLMRQIEHEHSSADIRNL